MAGAADLCISQTRLHVQDVKQEQPTESKWGPPPAGAPAAAYATSAPYADSAHQSYAPPPYSGQPQVQSRIFWQSPSKFLQ